MFRGSVLYVPEEWVLTYELPMRNGYVCELRSHGHVDICLRWYNDGACSVDTYRMMRPVTSCRYNDAYDPKFIHMVWEHICTYATHPLI
jgi:hypothetical protein